MKQHAGTKLEKERSKKMKLERTMRTTAIVQARTSSTRLPNKVLNKIQGIPMIIYQLTRVRMAKRINNVILATSTDSSDNELASIVAGAGFKVYRGELDDVLERYRACAALEKCSTIVRITGDCPFTDPLLVDEILDAFQKGSWDYLSNAANEDRLTVPDGFDIEVFSAKLLNKAAQEARLPSEREHVTTWMRSKSAKTKWGHYCHDKRNPYYRVTVDEKEDLEVARIIAERFKGRRQKFGVDEIVAFLNENPKIAMHNKHIRRNEGYLKSLEEDGKSNGGSTT